MHKLAKFAFCILLCNPDLNSLEPWAISGKSPIFIAREVEFSLICLFSGVRVLNQEIFERSEKIRIFFLFRNQRQLAKQDFILLFA